MPSPINRIDPAIAELSIEAHASTLEEALLYYMDHPVDWVEDTVGLTLYPWQKDLLKSLANRHYVSVRSGHGVGKTTVASLALLWFISTHPFCKVIATAPTKEQLFDVLWAECHKWIRTSQKLAQLLEWTQEKIFVKSNPEEWFAVARTAEVRKLGKTGLAVAEGLQGRHADSLFYLIDEASGIEEAIMSTIDGSLTSDDAYVMMTGNPTRCSGTFYDSFHSKRKMWDTYHVNCEDSPGVARGWCDRMLDKYGSRDHPMYLIRVRGEFPPALHNSVFSLDRLEEAMIRKLEVSPYDPVEIGVDVARYGGDLTAFAVKRGPVLLRIDTYPQLSTMETAGRTIQYIQEFKPISVKIDVVGVGAGVFDRLQELGYKECIPINNGASPTDDKQFFNLRAEAHWYLRDRLEQGLLALPKDEDLIAQATSLTYKISSRGKIQIESKEDLRDRGVKSPDRLDAVVLACMPAQIQQASQHFVLPVSIFAR